MHPTYLVTVSFAALLFSCAHILGVNSSIICFDSDKVYMFIYTYSKFDGIVCFRCCFLIVSLFSRLRCIAPLSLSLLSLLFFLSLFLAFY